MKLWDKLRGRGAQTRDEGERAQEDLEAEHRGEISDLPSHKRAVRGDRGEQGFPSAGGGYVPPH
jgi:hypothetical protein